jgi:GNAT superfamily N-acetyltransferase
MKARELIKETIEIEQRDEFIHDKYRHIFLSSPSNETPKFDSGVSYSFVHTIYDNVEYHGLLCDDQLVAIIIIEFERLGRPQIVYLQVDRSHRGQGLMRYLLNRVLDRHSEIYSDTHQTPAAKHFWKMLLIYPEPRYAVYIYDIYTDTKTKIMHPVGDVDGEIWNQQDNPVLVCIRNPVSERSVKWNDIRKKFGRDDWSLWYRRSVTPGYENP